MKIDIIIERIEATIKKMKALLPEKFNYSVWVTKTNKEHICGTVCCVGGWYPTWFPSSGIKLDENLEIDPETLSKYHGIDYNLVGTLFLGDDLYEHYQNKERGIWKPIKKDIETTIHISHKNGGQSKLPDVILVWEAVLGLIKEGRLKEYLKITR